MAELAAECKQDSKGSYLVVTVQADLKDYKEEMLKNNHIPGILPASIHALDNHRQLWYDTTGNFSLKKLFSQNAPGTEEISKLLRQLEEAGRRVEEYLLEADDLVLDLDYIFRSKEGDYSFLYLPDYRKDVGEQLQRLLEGLMEHMDYGNRQAVSLVYLLHARSRQKDGGIFSIRKLCDEIIFEESREAKASGQAEKEKQDCVPCPGARAMQNSGHRGIMEEKGGASARKGWMKRLGEKIKGFIGKMAEPQEEDEDSSLFGETELRETELQETVLRETVLEEAGLRETVLREAVLEEAELWETGLEEAGLRKTGLREAGLREAELPETTQLAAGQQDTVLLAGCSETVLLAGTSQDTMPLAKGLQPAALSAGAKPEYLLKPLEDGKEAIPIPSFPFQIGKEKKGGGHAFRDPVISRRHARIQQEQEDCYLVDLASLNGTFLNGERLRPNECRKIVPGDILGFADIFYIFTCSKG